MKPYCLIQEIRIGIFKIECLEVQEGFSRDNFFVADNPPFGTIFTYYLKEKYLSLKEKRIKEEKNNNQKPNWSKIESELNEIPPSVWIFIYSKENEILRKIKAKNNQGFNRVSWDLKSDANYLITDKNISKDLYGNMVRPDKYYAQLHKKINGRFSPISNKTEFNVNALLSHVDDLKNIDDVVNYWEDIEKLKRSVYELSHEINVAQSNLNKLLKAYNLSSKIDSSIERKILEIRDELNVLNEKFNGSKSKKKSENKMTIQLSGHFYGQLVVHPLLLMALQFPN